ncbi:methyltransferase domain-containing protein [uncultured Gimesia sp.]|jgi:SAM-dependent methyltransferase|uniref:methyltransferase domain-containing protein n=1 Tax=uncultured Gimesia sp. TaxID=1678688 RepID=UPI002607792D|nr:methyltransferase domain-containing protein [uncultured Gimesia sp.]
MNFQVRKREPELMDQPGLTEREHGSALAGLRRVNWWSRSSAILWPPILELARTVDQRPLQILDIASGGGDVGLDIALRAKRAGISVEVDGCDISSFAVRHATEQVHHRHLDHVHFYERDIFKEPLEKKYDVVMCSLFLHHLEEAQAVQLFQIMSQATRHLVLVNDLRRTRIGYWLAWAGCRLLTRSPIVHTDGPLSVAGAFTIQEAAELAEQGGLSGFQITRRWPQRWLLEWNRS